MKIKWLNKRWQRMLCWLGFMQSPTILFHTGRSRPTFKEAFFGYCDTSIMTAACMRNFEEIQDVFKDDQS